MKSFVFTDLSLLVVLGFSVLKTNGQSNGDLRLVTNSGLTGGSFGRLEVYYNGQWGTVCDDNFGSNDAKVACRQLMFSSYSNYDDVLQLGFNQASSSTRIWLDNLSCSGSEDRLIDCLAVAIGNDNCDHSEDIGLICTGTGGTVNIPSSPSSTFSFSAIIGGVAGSFIFIVFCCVIISIFVCVASQSRRQRVQYQPPRVVRPVSTAVVVAQTTANTQATAYPLQQPANPATYPPSVDTSGYLQAASTQPSTYPTQPYPAEQQYPAPYPSGPQQPPAPYPTQQPSGMTAPQEKGELGEPWNSKLHTDAPPAYPGLTDYPSAPPAMDTGSSYPGQ